MTLADSSSSMSVQDRISDLYKGACALSEIGLSWCRSAAKPQLPDLEIPASPDSEEFKQLLRVKLGVDDLATQLRSDSLASEAMSALIDLVWSLAIVGDFNADLLARVRRQIQTLAGSDSISPESSVKLLFAEATLFHQHAIIDICIDEETFTALPVATQTNALLGMALVGRHSELLKRLKRVLVSSLLHASDKASVAHVVPFALRAIMLASVVVGEDGHHDAGKLKSAFPELAKKNSRITWKYSFELCLACHAVASKGIELNPVVESAYPSDILFVPPKGRKKLVIELVRSSCLVRDEHEIVGVDAYTRGMRTVLAAMGYRIVAITLREWLALGGDKHRQMKYVKRRMRNCLRQRRLTSGMERDESDISDSGSDSDMSY